MSSKLRLLTYLLLALISGSVNAAQMDHKHTEGMQHQNSIANVSKPPTEGGQATFSAIIEIVALLEKDPNTDWSNINIDLLRSHLVDMNELMLNTVATKEVLVDNTIRFTVTGGTDRAIAAIGRMVPAHSGFIQSARGWQIEPELNATGATLTINTEDTGSIKRLNALGFYGFMSLESHHQTHHYQMAHGHAH